jgi:diguanylate cyclase (GGDEF)-like protein
MAANDAPDADDLRAQANALAADAQAHRLASRFRAAYDTSQRAAQLYQMVGDVAGEAASLALVAHAASNLGRNEEAVEAGLLSVELAAVLPRTQQALSHNYLGIAYYWSHSFERAAEALDRAAELAAQSDTPAAAFQPRLNRVWAEMVRCAHHRVHRPQEPLSLAPLQLAWERAQVQLDSGGVEALVPGVQTTARIMWQLVSSLVACWSRREDEAASLLAHACVLLAGSGSVNWLVVLRSWVEAEIAWARADWSTAEASLRHMVEHANRFEHDQLACLGELLGSEVARAQGRPADALAALHALRERERRIRVDSLESRAQVVSWQIAMRRSELQRRRLELTSRQFERLSFEDPLTGLANRRGFERHLAALLQEPLPPQAPLCLALIDVDRFKQVNDLHSHQVGDRVLCRLAEILRSHTRGRDLPARLAGDELVLVLAETELGAAQLAAERIIGEVAREPWDVLSPGLSVTVSVGVARAEAGDSVEALLHRSDVAMYRAKQSRRSESG